MASISKKRVVSAENEGRKTTFDFVPQMSDKDILCTDICKLANLCTKLKDPRDLKADDKCFCDFCDDFPTVRYHGNEDEENTAEDGDDDTHEIVEADERVVTYIPTYESVERGFRELGIDITQQLIHKVPFVPVKKVIDSCCKGIMDCYKEDYSGCSAREATCPLKNLFENGIVDDNNE